MRTITKFENDAYIKQIEGVISEQGLFKGFFKSKNIITPNILSYGTEKEYRYELAKGNGFEQGTEIVGVTVLEYLGNNYYKHRHDLSKSFDSRSEAYAYISRTFDDDKMRGLCTANAVTA